MADVRWSSTTKRTKTIWLVVLILLIFPAIFTVTLYGAFDPLLALFQKHTGATTGSEHQEIKGASGTRQMTFAEHHTYMNLSHEYDPLWLDLLTPNGGFIIKMDENDIKRRYGISMFHQLHCLGMMREAVQDMTERLALAEMPDKHNRDEKRAGQRSHIPRADGPGHWLHCFDYLRQTILCNADATIEPPHINNLGGTVVDGMNQRQCKDWTALYDASIQSDKTPESIGK